MVSTLVVGSNTYVSLQYATSYLNDSVRAAAWEGFDEDLQKRALLSSARILERQCWRGTKTNAQVAKTVAVTAGGTGYTVGDVLVVSSGTFGDPALVKVLTAPAGIIATVELVDLGAYSIVPSNPVSVSGGSGSGCTLTLTFGAQSMQHPRDGSYEIPVELANAQCEMAFDIAIDSSQETAGGVGSNTRRLQAGSVSIEYFRPTGGVNGQGSTRFPAYIMELIGALLCSGVASGISGVFASGTGEPSTTLDDGGFGLSEGYP